MNKYTFGDNIFVAMKKAGVTQKVLSERVGVSTNTISSWVRGARFAPSDKLYLVSKAVGVSMDDLMKGVEND